MPRRCRAARRGATLGARVRAGAASIGVGVAVALAVLLAPAAAVAKGGSVPAHPDQVLSNETTNTIYSIPDYAVAIRTAPSPHASRITSLRFSTPDGFVQTYILLREHWVGRQPWVMLRVPMRPNGRTGWVPRWALDTFTQLHTELVVDRATQQLTLFRNGKVEYRAPVGVGKPSTPTPPGHFWITESFPSTDPFYGPWAFGTSDYSTLSEWPGGGIVGLHGTNAPQLIPGDPSHGCVRLRNSDVSALVHLVPIGTPLWIQ